MKENNWKKRIHKKIKKETKLAEEFVILYDFFIEASNLTDGIVMFGEVKNNLRKFIEYAGEDSNNYNIETFYEKILKVFKEKGLIEDHFSGNGTTYPKIIGYNYYNDEEFFFKTKSPGDKEWNGRVSRNSINKYTILRELKHGSKFENKELEQMVLN